MGSLYHVPIRYPCCPSCDLPEVQDLNRTISAEKWLVPCKHEVARVCMLLGLDVLQGRDLVDFWGAVGLNTGVMAIWYGTRNSRLSRLGAGFLVLVLFLFSFLVASVPEVWRARKTCSRRLKKSLFFSMVSFACGFVL